MTDAAEPPPDDAKARAAYYRARAFEVRKRAVAISWVGLRSSFLQIAVMADSTSPWRERAMDGILYSGSLVRDARSDVRGRFEIGCQACSSSSSALASFKSSVSNPSVNQP
jgi:hypothetical protein